MTANYKHTQTNGWLRLALVFPAFPLLIAAFLTGKSLLFVPLATILGAFGWFFSSLTVEVTERELIWFFGPGVWRKGLARADIRDATAAQNKWWWGWGIHLTPRGWLYNVGGLDAVEILLTSGRTLRIGSDEAAKLADVLNGH